MRHFSIRRHLQFRVTESCSICVNGILFYVHRAFISGIDTKLSLQKVRMPANFIHFVELYQQKQELVFTVLTGCSHIISLPSQKCPHCHSLNNSTLLNWRTDQSLCVNCVSLVLLRIKSVSMIYRLPIFLTLSLVNDLNEIFARYLLHAR